MNAIDAYASSCSKLTNPKFLISLSNYWLWLVLRIKKVFKGLICSNPSGNEQEQARFSLNSS